MLTLGKSNFSGLDLWCVFYKNTREVILCVLRAFVGSYTMPICPMTNDFYLYRQDKKTAAPGRQQPQADSSPRHAPVLLADKNLSMDPSWGAGYCWKPELEAKLGLALSICFVFLPANLEVLGTWSQAHFPSSGWAM